jgi:class 3 adenylate cyclase
MFCDVSGFTKLAEAMAKSGMGAEGLAKYLNQVLQLLIIACSATS